MRGAASTLAQRFDREAIFVDFQQDHAAGRIGAAQRTALRDLRPVPGGTGMLAALQWQGRDNRRVGRTAAQNDIGPGVERGVDLFRAGKRNDIFGARQSLVGDIRRRRQGCDAAVV